jgi:micrococcal nuclease
MSAWNKLFSGKTVVWSLIVLLIYLVYGNLHSPDSSLIAIRKRVSDMVLALQLSPTPPIDKNMIEPSPDEAASQSSGAVQGASTGRQVGQVVKVVDGDTIDVEIGGVRDKIRVIGINTPEVVDPRRPVQCFGKEASNFAKQILSGKTVQLESDPTQADRDKYKRLLRFVFLNDGAVDYGKLAIQEGYANEYTYDTPYKYQSEYKKAEREARNAKKGLWADNACPKK